MWRLLFWRNTSTSDASLSANFYFVMLLNKYVVSDQTQISLNYCVVLSLLIDKVIYIFVSLLCLCIVCVYIFLLVLFVFSLCNQWIPECFLVINHSIVNKYSLLIQIKNTRYSGKFYKSQEILRYESWCIIIWTHTLRMSKLAFYNFGICVLLSYFSNWNNCSEGYGI